MKLGNYKQFDLTYCSNIYSGDTWEDIFKKLKKNIPKLKTKISPNKAFGIGLRLSNSAAIELLKNNSLIIFQEWLNDNGCYVATINGFVYGDFYNTNVKDKVYQPDWTTIERANFNFKLIEILCKLCPAGGEIGFSTSPLAYKFSLNKENPNSSNDLIIYYLFILIKKLLQISEKEGKTIHIDFEPEADCLLENICDITHFFEKILFIKLALKLVDELNISLKKAKTYIVQHIRVCYDICHQAVQFEDHIKNFELLNHYGIKIGKIQLSSALEIKVQNNTLKNLIKDLNKFKDKLYLHQVVIKKFDGSIKKYRDLPEALNNFNELNESFWRIHYHLPIFVKNYNNLLTTNNEIQTVIKFLIYSSITSCLEIETYTWEILPEELKLDLTLSIIKEYEWVIRQLNE
uniref:Xylose isomerase n=1 Tax=Monodopsis sp. MarTras21 TaxID=1745953 RepID=A0A1D8RDF6_9STRA|nr:hypothetical protein [Monodopsis sp. MarTras21]